MSTNTIRVYPRGADHSHGTKDSNLSVRFTENEGLDELRDDNIERARVHRDTLSAVGESPFNWVVRPVQIVPCIHTNSSSAQTCAYVQIVSIH